MSGSLKTTYAGYLTVPTSADAPLVDQNETVIGGDIVKNFKAIGDVIQKKTSTGGVSIGSKDSGNSVVDGGACISSSSSNATNTNTVIIGSYSATAPVAYSVNNISNRATSYIQGITGWKGLSYSVDPSAAISSGQWLDISIPSTGYGILEVEVIYVLTTGVRQSAQYRVVINPMSRTSIATEFIKGDFAESTTDPFEIWGTEMLFDCSNFQNVAVNGFILNIHYTLMTTSSITGSSSSGSFSSTYGSTYGSSYWS